MRVRDLSAHGVALTGTRPLPKGSELLPRLRRADGTWLEVRYRAWATPTVGASPAGTCRPPNGSPAFCTPTARGASEYVVWTPTETAAGEVARSA